MILTRDTTYDGDVTIEKGDLKVADDFELELTTEDAGEDGLQADGTTTLRPIAT